MEQKDILKLCNISKEFPGVKALNDISFSVKKGDIHAIVGENGAGKSTLMKILSGLYPYGTYNGTFFFEGEETKFSCIKESEDAGIQIIYQELALCKLMTVVENIFLGNEIKNSIGVISKNKQIQKAKYYLDMVGLKVDPLTPVAHLGIGQQQLVEIAKAMSKNTKILILDEPTASLTEAESTNLLNILRKLKENGVTCIFITHRLNEVFDCADKVTIIRDGNVIHSDVITQVTEDKMIAYMVGREIKDMYPREEHQPSEVVLEVKNWSLNDPELPGRKLVNDVSFKARKGEILGIAGLMGAGRTELALSLFGCYHGYSHGEVLIENNPVKINSPLQAIKQGISYISEDRKRYGLNLKMNILDNITIASLKKISRFGLIDNIKKIKTTNRMIQDLKIKTPSSDQIVANLSGGNQQKVVLGKWLLTDPKVLILDEPTRGIDVGAKFEFYKLINLLIDKGVCVIMISSELPEVLGMSDRILVMHEGTITAELENKDLHQEKIMYHATGGF